MEARVTRRNHALVTRCRRLARGRSGDDDGLLLDGLHLLQVALDTGTDIEVAMFTSRGLDLAAREVRDLARSHVRMVEVADAVMDAMSPVQTPSGVLAIARPPSARIGLAAEIPIVLVAADVQDPGNLGAIIRTADAAGAEAVVAAGRSADPFGWKAIRGSMGSALRIPVDRVSDMSAVLSRLSAGGRRIVAAMPHDAPSVYELDWTQPTAVVLGGEGAGVTPAIVAACDARMSVPMRAGVESLNVVVAAAIVLYEARRQRGIH